jgi:SM-20-related protein
MLIIKKITDDLLATGLSNIDQIFEIELLQALHDEVLMAERENDLQNAKIGRLEGHILSKDIRRNKIKWLDGNSAAQKLLFTKLEFLRAGINENLMLGLFNIEAHYAVYKKGDFYKRHLDSFKGNAGRIVSLVIYLNKNWQEGDGGNLNIYKNITDKNPSSSTSPKWGNAVLFLSEETSHEVAVSNEMRYSIAAWFGVRKGDIP